MALSDEQIDAVTLLQWGEMKGQPLAAHRAYARAIEAEVRKQDEALIRQMMKALECCYDVAENPCGGITTQGEAVLAARQRLEGAHLRRDGDHCENHLDMVQVAVEPDEVLVAIKRPDGYEDVHPALLAEDVLPCATFEYRVVWPVDVAP